MAVRPCGAGAGGPGLRAPRQGRCGGPGAGGPPLGRCAAASGGASGRPGPGCRSAGRGELRRACWSWKAPGPPRGGWGSRGKRRPLCVVVVSLGFQRPSEPDETCTWLWGPAAAQSRSCRLSRARCPLSLDLPRTPGRVDQQVLQELAAAQE